MRLFIFITILATQLQAFASLEVSKQELFNLFQAIESNYGPLLIKKDSVGLNWEKTKAQITAQFENISSQAQYRNCASILLGMLQDSHVSISFPTSYKSRLPFQLSYVEGQTIINYIDTAMWDKAHSKTPFKIGDEVLAIDGKTPDQIRKELYAYHSGGNVLTDYSYLSMTITSRSEASGLPSSLIPTHNQVATIKLRRDGQIIEERIQWQSTGIKAADRELKVVDNNQYTSKLPVNHEMTPEEDAKIEQSIEQVLNEIKSTPVKVHKKSRLKSLLQSIESINKLFDTKISEVEVEELTQKGLGTPTRLGSPKPFIKLPDNFKQIKAPRYTERIINAGNFFAGTFERNGKRIGYLKIPSYSPENLMFSLYSIRYYMGMLEKESDLLIIDQWNNPGGYVSFGDWIVESLVGELEIDKHMKFAARPREGFLSEYTDLIKQLSNLMISTPNLDKATEEKYARYIQILEREFRKLYKSYLNGDYISEPISLAITSLISKDMIDNELTPAMKATLQKVTDVSGVDLTRTQHYTKPVYFLINELDFSCGDATPANLQDYGRVTLVGQNTGGAGGSVEEFKSEVFTPFNYRLTTSLMIRKDGKLVENYGVAPDIKFNFTKEDYQKNFQDTLERLLALLKL